METLSATSFADKIIMARQRARAEHERIFGKKSFRQLGMMDNTLDSRRFLGNAKATVKNVKIKKNGKKSKKTMCPHCATKNFRKVDSFTFRCTNCKFEQ